MFCIDCSKEICTNCVLFDDHKLHKYEQLSDAKKRFDQKIQKLRSSLAEARRVVEAVSQVEPEVRDAEKRAIDQLK